MATFLENIPFLRRRTLPELQGTVLQSATPAKNKFCIYLPPGYKINAPADQQRQRYPVSYFLHGSGDSQSCTRKNVALIAEQLEAHDQQQPMIIVAPIDPSKNSFWSDTGKLDMATRVLRDVLPFVESAYAVDSSQRSLQGFSMGGFGAATWACKFPEFRFHKVVIWDGAVVDWKTLNKDFAYHAKATFQNRRDSFNDWSPFTVALDAATRADLGRIQFLIYTGRQRKTRDTCVRFREHLLEMVGGRVLLVQTDHSHSMREFIEGNGQEALAFLLGGKTKRRGSNLADSTTTDCTSAMEYSFSSRSNEGRQIQC